MSSNSEKTLSYFLSLVLISGRKERSLKNEGTLTPRREDCFLGDSVGEDRVDWESLSCVLSNLESSDE